MPKNFDDFAKKLVFAMQGGRYGSGYARCMKCDEKIQLDRQNKNVKEGWFAIPNIPIENGGRLSKQNCLIVCSDCYVKIMSKRKASFK